MKFNQLPQLNQLYAGGSLGNLKTSDAPVYTRTKINEKHKKFLEEHGITHNPLLPRDNMYFTLYSGLKSGNPNTPFGSIAPNSQVSFKQAQEGLVLSFSSQIPSPDKGLNHHGAISGSILISDDLPASVSRAIDFITSFDENSGCIDILNRLQEGLKKGDSLPDDVIEAIGKPVTNITTFANIGRLVSMGRPPNNSYCDDEDDAPSHGISINTIGNDKLVVQYNDQRSGHMLEIVYDEALGDDVGMLHIKCKYNGLDGINLLDAEIPTSATSHELIDKLIESLNLVKTHETLGERISPLVDYLNNHIVDAKSFVDEIYNTRPLSGSFIQRPYPF